jgi:hypothetical protein
MPLIYHSVLQLYHILIGYVQITIILLIEVIVVIKGVKSSLGAFVILAIIITAIKMILYLFLNLYVCEVLTDSSL